MKFISVAVALSVLCGVQSKVVYTTVTSVILVDNPACAASSVFSSSFSSSKTSSTPTTSADPTTVAEQSDKVDPTTTSSSSSTSSSTPSSSSTKYSNSTVAYQAVRILKTSSDPTTTPTTTSVPTTTSSTPTTTSSTATAQSTSNSLSSTLLTLHNTKRALHGASPLSWDSTLAQYAQNYADKYDCSGLLLHSGGQYGENLAVGYQSVSSGFDAWYNEGNNYDYSSANTFNHFTQIIWKDTTKLGCAIKDCSSENWGIYLICEYDPAGNMVNYGASNLEA